MNASLRYVPRPPFQFGRPGIGHGILGFLQAGQQFFGDTGALGSGKAQCLCNQIIGGHGVSLAVIRDVRETEQRHERSPLHGMMPPAMLVSRATPRCSSRRPVERVSQVL